MIYINTFRTLMNSTRKSSSAACEREKQLMGKIFVL